MSTPTKFIASLFIIAAFACRAQTNPLPHLQQNGEAKQLFVDDKPFIMLAGELHNSSASSIEYMAPLWNKLATLHLNTVIGTASWELVEPEEGKLDFSLVDDQINQARQRNMRLVLIWFATWKNAGSSYPPAWIKADPKRFPPMLLKVRPDGGMGSFLAAYMEQQGTGPLSPFGKETLKADSAAFAALTRHIAQVDPQHTVIMMQVENEIGSVGDSRDRSPMAEAAWSAPVPAPLLTYLTKHKSTLLPEVEKVWANNGYKTTGTWPQIFGNDAWADQIFMAWYMATYVNQVAAAGKAQLNIPMYVNAWLGPQPKAEHPGQFPSGGPVAGVMDIYRAAAPAIDLFAPDIYVPDFKSTCALYIRSGNPLFIPEAMDQVGNLFWALGHHAALGWSPFGIEDLSPEGQVAQAYRLLTPMLPQLAQWQAAGKLDAILTAADEKPQPASLGGYNITLAPAMGFGTQNPQTQSELGAGVSLSTRAMPADKRPFALIINTAPDEFILIGANADPTLALQAGTGRVFIASKEEGRFENGKWIPGRRINGDETFESTLPSLKIGMVKIKLVRSR